MYHINEQDAPTDVFTGENARVVKTLLQPPVSKDILMGTSVLAPGSVSKAHRHDLEEVFYVLEGNGEFIIDGATIKVETGSLVYAPRNAMHQVQNKTDKNLKVLFATTPPFTRELFLATHK